MGTTSGEKRARRLNAVVVVLVTGILVLLGSMLATQSGGSDAEGTGEQPQTQAQQSNPLDSLARRAPDDPLALGEPDAPVVMLSYEDFRCPFCAKFSNDIAPELIERYVDTGVLRIEWRDFPIFGDESVQAAQAGRAAARQGKFWEFKEVVYSHAPDTGHPSLPASTLVEYAQQADVPDIAQFEADMNDPDIAEAVRTDAAEGSQIGISSTPTFIVNGDPIMGAQPLPEFVTAIEQAESAAR